MDTEEKISAFVLIQVAVIALSQVLLVAFAVGFIFGHFLTGSDKVVTVSAQALVKEEQQEATAEEAEPEEAIALAKQEEAEHTEQVAMVRQEKEAEKAEAAEAKEAEEGGGEEAGGEEAAGEEGGAEEGGGESAMTAGKEIFTSNCGSCHTLSEAGTTGEVGPNLDQLKPEQSTVETQVMNGGGVMPSFEGTLSSTEITEVAEYVSSVAGTG
jgi:cytochrome c6